jgi:hypothetical protein
MSRNATIAVVVGAIVAAVVVGWLALRFLGGVSEEDYAKNFTSSCQDARRQLLIREGKAPADAQAGAASYCACALEVVAQRPMNERRQMERDKELAQKIATEVVAKCMK